MDKVEVVRSDLKAKLEENLAQHLSEYNRAMEKFRRIAARDLRTRAAEIETERTTDTSFSLPVPVSYAREYERALEKLKWHIGDTISLDDHDFRSLVQDDWDWGRSFATSTLSYNRS